MLSDGSGGFEIIQLLRMRVDHVCILLGARKIPQRLNAAGGCASAQGDDGPDYARQADRDSK